MELAILFGILTVIGFGGSFIMLYDMRHNKALNTETE